jgi:two-component system sensor histidine kinase DegS
MERAVDVEIIMDIPPSELRYDPKVEEHLYRIVQQAGENALRHAHAKTIRFVGKLEPKRITLIIEDDGIGLAGEDQLDFDRTIANKHFGMVGMFERAALIGADLQIKSVPGQGTRVSIDWTDVHK